MPRIPREEHWSAGKTLGCVLAINIVLWAAIYQIGRGLVWLVRLALP